MHISRLARIRATNVDLITFDMIPDDVLLELFDFYVHEDVNPKIKQRKEKWIRLAHVCQRWRCVVFQSPHRLNLRLICTHRTPTRDLLNIWSPFPLVICDSSNQDHRPFLEDNIIAALEHNDRVCKIQLVYPKFGYLTNSAAILRPFPELTVLQLSDIDRYREPEPIRPDSFLGGYAPRLEMLYLNNVPYLGLPKLLLSATRLLHLELTSIPRSGYIPPELMATSLSSLTSLEFLCLWFDYPPSPFTLDTQRLSPPPSTRSILPSLTKIEFKGASEYLEVILARIDAPRLNKLYIVFFNQLIFDTPQLFQFIRRRQTLRAQKKGHIEIHSTTIIVKFPSETSDYDVLNIGIRCTASEWQLSSLEQICTSFLPPASTLEDLYIFEPEYRYFRSHWQDDVENRLWLDLLHSFVAVKNLYISEDLVHRIAPALQDLVEGRAAEVLPALEKLSLEGFQTSAPVQKGIERFVAARLLTPRPVVVSRWDRR